jgi:lauroyl/myristoyl acyltransferase
VRRFGVRELLRRVPGLSRTVGALRHGREFTVTVMTSGFASVTPQALDPILCGVVQKVFVRLRPVRVEKIAGRIERTTGTPGAEITSKSYEDAKGYWRMRIEVRYGEARGAGLRPWRPNVTVEGVEHIEQSLKLGNGAILWRMSFTSATVVNWGLREAGFRVVHLSSNVHRGASRSWFAEKISAPLYTRPEARLVDKRVIRQNSGNLAYLKELRADVEGNAVVTMVGDLTKARHTETHKVGNLRRDVPTGAPSLAYASGASLHTCVALREGPYRYRLIIGPDIAAARVSPKSSARRAATTQFAAELEHHLATSPESSMWWGRRG